MKGGDVISRSRENLMIIIILILGFLAGFVFPQKDPTVWKPYLTLLGQISIISLGFFGVYIVYLRGRDIQERRETDSLERQLAFGKNEPEGYSEGVAFDSVKNKEIMIWFEDEGTISKVREISKNDNGTNQKTAQEYQKRAEDLRSDIRRLLRARYILTNIISYDDDKQIQSTLETSSKSILKAVINGLSLVVCLTIASIAISILNLQIPGNITFIPNIITGWILILWIGYTITLVRFGLILSKVALLIPENGASIRFQRAYTEKADRAEEEIKRKIHALEEDFSKFVDELRGG